MVQATVYVNDMANQILSIVKARFNFKDKSEAINFVTMKYGEEFLEPELRPEFIEKMKKIEKEKTIRIGSFEDFKKRYGGK